MRFNIMNIIRKAMFVVCFTIACQSSIYAEDVPILTWDQAAGATVKTSIATLRLDRNDNLSAPLLKFTAGGEVELKNPKVAQPNASRLKLTYDVASPGGVALKVVRELTLKPQEENTDLVEVFQITPERPITDDLEIIRPFTISSAKDASKASAVCPLFNGWAKPYSLSEKPFEVEYRLGNVLRGKEVDRLALPVIQLDQPKAWRAALTSDCRFSALFSVSAAKDNTVQGVVRYRYACSQVPLRGTETRQFGLWLAPPPPANEPFGKSLDSFFRLMLPDVPPGPKWQHEIAMVYYDFLSENGLGWERDINELARLLKPEERRRVALCFHGWYESLGGYSYDDSTGKMKPEWIAMGRTRKVHMTQVEMKRRLQAAKDLGFRVMLYFGDGLGQDSKNPTPDCYHADWDYQDAKGNRINGWEGPDTWGTNYMRNPSHPEVVAWYGRYLKALLTAYGSAVDGFVWDETNYIPLGLIAQKPAPAYCDQGMLDLIKTLRQQVKEADPEKAFFVSDINGPERPWGNVNYSMMADGIFQDSWCKPDCWSYCLFPTWRNTMWSCCWASMRHISWIRWGVENFGTPVAISNGYDDDIGPSEWKPKYRDAVLELFYKRLAKTPVRFLTEDPAILLASSPEAPPPSDKIPAPAADEKNWALASNGAKATASSQLGGAEYSPMGLIDGIRDDTNWMNGHGWASHPDQPLPQWVEIDFSQPRSVSRFVIINYAEKSYPWEVNTWGTKNYDIEIWDSSANAWKPVVSEKKDRLMLNRVHFLDQPIQTTKFRVMIKDIAPLDNIVRLLQIEAWGKQ